MDACLIPSAVALLVSGLGAIALTDGAVRREIKLSLARRMGGLFSPSVIVVGDSLAASCPWERLVGRPFGVLNLATGGATLKEIAGQIYRARGVAASYLLINGGLNDLLFDEARADQIEADFLALLRRIGNGPRVVVTLAPFVDDPAQTDRITSANEIVSRLCRERGYLAVDLNPALCVDGVRRSEMSADGLHFTRAAELVWIDATRAAIVAQGPAPKGADIDIGA